MVVAEFNTLLLRNADFLSPFAVKLTKDWDDAKDLVQETLFRVLSNRDKYEGGTNFKAWMYTIMRNIFINNYRRKAKEIPQYEHSSVELPTFFNPPLIENSAESNMNIKLIQQYILALPFVFKTPFVMFYEGYKYNEIAMILQEPLGTIKSRIYFARKLLKEMLAKNS